MSDIDLLNQEEDFEATGRMIKALGYVEGATTWRHREYLPANVSTDRAFGEHIDNPVKIELHGRIVARLPLRDVVITAQVFPRPAHAGLNPYPSLAALMLHLLQHSAGDICFRGIRLIHLHDIAALASRLKPADWDGLLRPGPDGQGPWWALAPLAIVDRYFPGRIPAPILSRAAAQCPPVLRWASRRYRITDISLSRLGTPLLPGVEWSRSMTEAFAWAFMRLYPGRAAIASTKQAALGQHALAGSAWAHQSHWRKALRALAGNAPRSATMYSVQRALDYRAAATSSRYSASTRVKV